MTIREAKILAIKKLNHTSPDEAPIAVEILLAHVLKISREELLTHDERNIPASAKKKFDLLIARRAKHEPVAYLTGHKEFFGLNLSVNKHTLIPRPETELLVEEALTIINSQSKTGQSWTDKFQEPVPISRQIKSKQNPKSKTRPTIIDVGTGSGAIAIAIAKHAPQATVIATDISKPALKLATKNAITNRVLPRLIFKHANLLDFNISRPRNIEITIITANLPYLPTKVWQKCAPDVKKFEPKTALVAGQDGLKYYNELFLQINKKNIRPTIICEIDPSQEKSFPKLAKRYFPDAAVEIKNDLAHLPRVGIVTL